MTQEARDSPRIVSLDQFRGYTVLGMFVVDFLGHFHVIRDQLPVLKHHNTYCSYADTIMPQFFFAVGFAYRLTLLRRLEALGPLATYLRVLWRNLGLILLGVVLYHLDGKADTWQQLRELGVWGFMTTAFQRNVFQTLVHIGVTAIWIMPVIGAGPWVRVAYACLSGLLHVALSYGLIGGWSYYDWVMARPGIDGGPLGFLTWAIPMLAGSLAYDALVSRKGDAPAEPQAREHGSAQAVASPPAGLLVWGFILMLLGYALACLNLFTPPVTAYEQEKARELSPTLPSPNLGEGRVGAAESPNLPAAEPSSLSRYLVEPPFVPPTRPVNVWTMSQRAGSVSYHVFGAGFSLAVFALFVFACDARRLQVGVFRTLGTNALAAYIIHMLVDDAIKAYAPKDAPLWYALTTFAVFFAICYVFLRHMEKQRLFPTALMSTLTTRPSPPRSQTWRFPLRSLRLSS